MELLMVETMSLDDAIEHLEKKIPGIECYNCRKEHEQLREWLQELKERRVERVDANYEIV